MTILGSSIPRLEDRKLLTGGGEFTANLQPADAAHAVFVRSLHAHARIAGMDVAAARRAKGVLAVLTGEDAAAAGLGKLQCAVRLPGQTFVDPRRPILAQGTVRFVGEAVVCVVAETIALAKDAAELVLIDYEPLASVTETSGAITGVQIWPDAAHNIAFDWSAGDAAAVEEAFAAAARVVSLDIVNNRVAVAPLETRCAWARYDAADGRYRLHTPSQGVFFLRDCLAGQVFHVGREQIEVLTGDVGGAFGMKIVPHPEHACVMWASKVTSRPVAWVSDRGESFSSDTHARDHVTRASLALDAKGCFLALRHDVVANLGAYLSAVSPTVPTVGYAKMAPSVYDIRALHIRVRGVFSNTAPTEAYRGAGKPEALFALERLIDTAARELEIDPAALRRRNLIKPTMMPYTSAAGQTYDAGDFPRALNRALTLADAHTFARRRRQSAKAGRLRGLGHAFYIHGTGGDPDETAKVVVDASGVLVACTSRQDSGQGHRTVYAQLLAERFGIPIERIQVRQGDSRTVPPGGGTGGSSSLIIGGVAMVAAGQDMLDKAKERAARTLEVAEGDIEYGDGRFRVKGTDVTLDLFALAAQTREPLAGLARFAEKNASYPYGCQVVEVEIDPLTGGLEILNYVSVDDLGQVVHPALAEGQLVGGIAQGLGQALYETVRYDPESGQLLTGSFMDYALPHADQVPPIGVAFIETPTANNSLGIKGAGECGTMGAAPAVINAIVDALAAHGIRHVDMPATPENIWRALRSRAERP